MIATQLTKLTETETETETKIPTATFTFAGRRFAIRHKSKHEPQPQWRMFGTVVLFLAHQTITQFIQHLRTAAATIDEFMKRHNMDYIPVILTFGHIVFGASVGLIALSELDKSSSTGRPFQFNKLLALHVSYLWGLAGFATFVGLHLLCLAIGACLAATQKRIVAVVRTVDEVV